MNTIRGNLMSVKLQREALSRYVHRYTMEHIPQWARKRRPDGAYYAPQFSSDAEWLAHTDFWVTKRGELAQRPSECRCNPTWPIGQTLNQPFAPC